MGINRAQSQHLAAVILTALLLGHAAFAAEIPECVPGTLSGYLKLGAQGCRVGDKRFANFSYRSTNGVPAEAISVNPGAVADTEDPALLFEAQWAAPSDITSSIGFSVEALASGKPVTDASLEMQSGQIAGTGEASVGTEMRAIDGIVPSSAPALTAKLQVALHAAGRRPVDSAHLSNPARVLAVEIPVHLAAGKGGDASLKGFMLVFRSAQVPTLSAGSGGATAAAAGGQ
jgi:hypothetical protein